MYKKISRMTAEDKADFLEKTKQAVADEQGVPWKTMEKRLRKAIDDTFDDEKFVKMNPDDRIDAAYARKEFGDQKPELVDYILWMYKFTTKSEFAEW